jgi:hypothetical protein
VEYPFKIGSFSKQRSVSSLRICTISGRNCRKSLVTPRIFPFLGDCGRRLGSIGTAWCWPQSCFLKGRHRLSHVLVSIALRDHVDAAVHGCWICRWYDNVILYASRGREKKGYAIQLRNPYSVIVSNYAVPMRSNGMNVPTRISNRFFK